MSPLKTAVIMSAISITSVVNSVSAHTTIVKKNTPYEYAARSELEGASGVFNAFSISHGCGAPGSSERQPVRAQSVVFPNGASSVAVKADGGEVVYLADEIMGNPIMSPKPVQDYSIFRKLKTMAGPVPEFNSHGLKTSDNRAFYFTRGKLHTDMIGMVPFRASFPTFKPASCAHSLRVNMAIANYCKRSKHRGDRADIWIAHLTEKFNDDSVVSIGFWPYIEVVRNTDENPLAASCGDGYQIEVSPSAQDIDKYLPIHGYWPAHYRNRY